MTTPQETRDRIKEMRERIFDKPGKESVETNIQETSPEDDLAGKEINVVPEQEGLSINENIKETKQKNDTAEKKPSSGQENEAYSNRVEITNSIENSFSEKLQQNDDRISLLSADTKKTIY